MPPTPTRPAAEARKGRVPADEHEHGQGHEHREEQEHPLEWVDLVRIGLVALAAVASWFGLSRYFASFDVIALVATLAGGYPIFKPIFPR